MKKFLILFAIAYSNVYGQNYNLSLENWNSTTYYKSPQGWWETLNKIEDLNFDHGNSVATVYQDTSHVEGNYSARMVTKKYGSFLLPGTLAVGTLDLAKQDLLPGKPFTQNITSLSGYYKYQPVNGDSAMLYVHLSKWNTVLNKRDTLASAKLIEVNTITAWTQFTLNLEEKIAGQTPDSMNIIFVSSADGENMNGQVGSTLWIDNLSFAPSVSREKIANNFGIHVFPNPASHNLNITAQKHVSNAEITIFDLSGKSVFSSEMTGVQKNIDINLAPGMYVLEMKQDNTIIYTQKWVCQP